MMARLVGWIPIRLQLGAYVSLMLSLLFGACRVVWWYGRTSGEESIFGEDGY